MTTEENKHFHNSFLAGDLSKGDNYGSKENENCKLEIENLRKQSDEYLNGWKRAKADYLNLKKEMEAQNKEIKEWLSKIFLLPLLDIMDSFDRAGILDAGIEGIKKQFEDFLKANGVEEMKVVGEKFDPLKHEAIESVDGGESGRIIEEVRRGYLVNGEVFRPAKVKVYK